MADFALTFNAAHYEELDQYALLACQKYNLGNATDWFGAFRGGLYGVYARLHGVATHYRLVHAWLPSLRLLATTDYHLASIFFNIDSAIECFTFALNALGSAAGRAGFRDVTDARALRDVMPRDILGDSRGKRPRPPLSGYSKFFPTVQACWQKHRVLIDRIVEQHDVSKHRQTIFCGGRVRSDPPPGFYENLGCSPDDPTAQAVFSPMEEIILMDDARSPALTRRTPSNTPPVLLDLNQAYALR